MLRNAPVIPYIPATDIKRAREFYETKVGLVPKVEIGGEVVYECGAGSWIYLYQSAGAGTSEASQAFWQVDDVEAGGQRAPQPRRDLRGVRRPGHEDRRWDCHRGRRQGRLVQGQ